MRVLDLYSGAGGAGAGYTRAGYDLVGVDITPQPRYPGTFWHIDALTVLRHLLDGKQLGLTGNSKYNLRSFDLIHASPPCQAFSLAQRIQDRDHPDLINPTRQLLTQTGLPWVIENVVGAPLHNPTLLCGAMFPELRVYRHRLFETSFPLTAPTHPAHTAPIQKMGRPPQPHHYMHVVGNFSGVQQAREAMGIPWMMRDELREAIPPAYTEWIAREAEHGKTAAPAA